MLAASFWSLLAPAIEMAVEFSGYSESFAFIPGAIGLIMGALFVYACDKFVPEGEDWSTLLTGEKKDDDETSNSYGTPSVRSYNIDSYIVEESGVRRRLQQSRGTNSSFASPSMTTKRSRRKMMRRMLLLVIAITVHNFPEGLAVGVGFGAVGLSESATLVKAWNLALGIGIQNFPEGFAVSMPLHRAGMSKFKSFFIGQLSGVVEPIAGVLGALVVSYAQSVLPYALGFAAGAMIFVVVNDLVPEAQKGGGDKPSALPSWGAIAGFVVMMSLDVAFG